MKPTCAYPAERSQNVPHVSLSNKDANEELFFAFCFSVLVLIDAEKPLMKPTVAYF